MEEASINQSDQIVEATWGRTLKIWWWITWRSVLVAFLGGLVIGFIIGLIMALAGASKESMQSAQPFLSFIGFIVGIMVNIWFFKLALNRKFKGFSLSLIRTEV